MFGLSPEQARHAVTSNCRSVILHGGTAVTACILQLKLMLIVIVTGVKLWYSVHNIDLCFCGCFALKTSFRIPRSFWVLYLQNFSLSCWGMEIVSSGFYGVFDEALFGLIVD